MNFSEQVRYRFFEGILMVPGRVFLLRVQVENELILVDKTLYT